MTSEIEAAAALDEMEQPNWLANGWRAVLRRWWLVLGVTLIATLIAVFYLRGADYLYTASLRVSPAPSAQPPRQGLGALSSLASLAGVSTDTAEAASPFRLYLEGVYAPEVADRLAREPDVMHTIFARDWDPVRRVWRAPSSTFGGLRKSLYGLLNAPVAEWQPPNGERLRQFIADNVGVGQSTKSPLATVSFEATDPAFAMHFLTLLDRADDEYLRAKTLARSRQNVTYLSQELGMATLAEHRQVLSAQLSDQERQLMMASNPAPYAADPFGRVTVSPQPTHPKPIAVLMGFILAGLVLGVVLALLMARRTE